jgi:hypothetical protein
MLAKALGQHGCRIAFVFDEQNAHALDRNAI